MISPLAMRPFVSYFVTLLGTTIFVPIVYAASLNDTGQTSCYNALNAPVACSTAVGGDTAANPRQDARYGRDAQAAVGTGATSLTKTGAGAAGFDFTKIANSGETLAPVALLGGAATDWSCTKDNVTNLVWEVKTTSGLRSSAHKYTWYSTQTGNGGNPGGLGGNTCGGTLSAAPYNNQCNTQNYIAAVNLAGLCGASDWRLPTQKELLSIVHSGAANPSIDATYFPNTISSWHTTVSLPNPTYVTVVYFDFGSIQRGAKTDAGAVRLVRGGL